MLIPYSPSRLDTTFFLKKMIRPEGLIKKKIIDIGCGKLFFFNLLSELKWKGDYLGVDIKQIKLKPPDGVKAKIVTGDFLKTNFKTKFDLVACLWALEHIKSDQTALNKIAMLLGKKGSAILAVPSIWSWPIEFGRHGYHYYSKETLKEMVEKAGLRIISFHEASGFVGLVFMFLYNWPRFLILAPGLLAYKLMKLLRLSESSWEIFSSNLISKTLYRYHASHKMVKLHNKTIEKIVSLDNKIKIFPSSYLLVLKK